MRIAIIRREPRASYSMDVYADALVNGLKTVRPDWEIIELAPEQQQLHGNTLFDGLSKYYQRYWNYPQNIKKQDVDIFHVIDHSDGHLVYWLKNTGKPTIVTCHDLVNFIHPENARTQAQIASVSMAAWKWSVKGLRKANHIISVSSHTAKDVVQILNVQPEGLTVVPNGVDSVFRPFPKPELEVFRQQHQVSPEKICLLNVGSNQPRKNFITVLRVLEALKSKGMPIHLLRTGPKLTEDFEAFIHKHNLSDCITDFGRPDKATLVKIYNTADILLSPSLYEGFGITILEAMACGKPVITSNVTSLPEVVSDAGILVNPMDVKAMVEAVSQLQNDVKFRQTLIDKGLDRVKLFTWEQTAEQVAKVYSTFC
ncbi:glycosyltransferase family 1 protein [Rivularia sp. UHCC 0363]|uniref:glycosyltransferase family 4 protein n=1 Tax=Rivularia sp. UHCC 0363 TaxID=3110244 RepID=UPI002B203CDD|nr:glycosyltransferase family 1 protein [Rivularia sp. UHCC 0363]MEA5598356.1 glycosyltransferase family 1 protein [Rivularia sp. UHCC 0363]